MMNNHLHTAGRRGLAAIAAACTALLLAACSGASSTPGSTPDAAQSAVTASAILAPFGLDGLDARELIDHLDALPIDERPEGLFVSIRPATLEITSPTGETASLPMPTDAFYVSIAPYVDQTHECYYHSLTTCTGEMRQETVGVVATDLSTGDVLVDGDLTTFANGFVGMWLPRDTEVEVTITRDGRAATSTLSTSAGDDATCVTTMQLA